MNLKHGVTTRILEGRKALNDGRAIFSAQKSVEFGQRAEGGTGQRGEDRVAETISEEVWRKDAGVSVEEVMPGFSEHSPGAGPPCGEARLPGGW